MKTNTEESLTAFFSPRVPFAMWKVIITQCAFIFAYERIAWVVVVKFAGVNVPVCQHSRCDLMLNHNVYKTWRISNCATKYVHACVLREV